MIAELPLNALPPPAVALVETVGAAAVVVDTVGCGKPCSKGFAVVDCANAAAGDTSAAETTAARRARMDLTAAPLRA
jgi:hypothetical protein